MPTVASEMIQVYVCRKADSPPVEFLVLRRATDDEVYPNIWQVVTGHIHAGETAHAAAKRELREETGLTVETLLVLPYVASFYIAGTDTVHLVPVFAAMVDVHAVIALSSEHQDYRWLTAADARRTLVFPSHKKGLDILAEYILETAEPGIVVSI
jgi:dihydroneopterin triphosphate diphosphatase